MAKKLFPIFIILCILYTSLLQAAANYQSNLYLSDTDSHWAEDDITVLYGIGILSGAYGKSNPDQSITRGEFAAFIARALDLKPTNEMIFYDVDRKNVFFDVINASYKAKIITGHPDGSFCPNDLITREEIMLIISRCLEYDNLKEYSFYDIPANYLYRAELEKSVASGIIAGYSDNTFRPKSNATRAEAASMTVRLLKSKGNIRDKNPKSIAKEYIQNEFSDKDPNRYISCGSALKETDMKIYAENEILRKGVNVTKKISNLKIYITAEGSLATAQCSAYATYTVNSPKYKSSRKYKVSITIKMIQKSDGVYVYHYNQNLIYPEKINLAWDVYSEVPDTAPDGINIISPSSFQISADNLNVDSTSLYGNIKFYNALTTSYTSYAKNNGYDIWAIYKTDFNLQTSHTFLNNSDIRKKAVNKLIDYICKYEISGINIDFENMYQNDKALFTTHVREVTLAMHEMGLIVSADVTRKEPKSSNWSMCFDRDALSETVDYMAIMAYDEHYAGGTKAGSVASIGWTEDTIIKTLNETDPEKLILGMPLYMRYWEEKNGKVLSSKAISMQTALRLANENNATYTYIENDGQYKVWWQSNGKTYSYWLENYDTITKRVKLAVKYDLAGVASWRRGLETPDIWQAIKNNLY